MHFIALIIHCLSTKKSFLVKLHSRKDVSPKIETNKVMYVYGEGYNSELKR